jgi:hypothetical protein
MLRTVAVKIDLVFTTALSPRWGLAKSITCAGKIAGGAAESAKLG